MKVVDLQLYRAKRTAVALEKRIGELVTTTEAGVVRKIKTCFKLWLKMNTK